MRNLLLLFCYLPPAAALGYFLPQWLPLVDRGVAIGVGLLLLALGGLAYTGGVVFYAWQRLPFNHAVWHVFVLAGSACHFSCVLGYVIPPAA